MRTEAAPLRDEAAALLRTCPDPGRAATPLADDPRLPRQRAPEAGEEFTARVVAVLQLLPTQKSLRTIAADLYVSHNTVKTHTSLYRKLAASTREEAVQRARAAGLL